MADFQFIQDPISKKWITLAPRRARRPDQSQGTAIPICPFCPGRENEEPSVFEVKSQISSPKSQINSNIKNTNDKNVLNFDYSKLDITSNLDIRNSDLSSDWLVRVFPNKFPCAPVHEVIIHSPDHHKSFGELPVEQIELLLQTYRQRYNTHKNTGQVYIMNNTGEKAGESMPHPHSQLLVIPQEVALEIYEYQISDEQFIDAGLFRLGCPDASQWPDEVWFVPKQTGKTFGDISDAEISSLADGLDRLVRMYDHRYGHEFPFNFFVRPGLDWYLRLIPRVKSLGGFEVGTNVFVNTQDPKETIAFLREHWENPDFEKIKKHHPADYGRHV